MKRIGGLNHKPTPHQHTNVCNQLNGLLLHSPTPHQQTNVCNQLNGLLLYYIKL